jgi:hypothetical protein
MPSSPSQKHSAKEAAEERELSGFDLVIEKNRMTQIRQEIGIIADRSYRNNLIGDEAYEGYRELAEGREEHDISAEMLENSRKFAKEHEEKAIRIHHKIEAAIRAGVASEADEEFLMETLISENTEFVSQAGQIEGLIDAKLARMRKDREQYDFFAKHKLIKDSGCLEIDENTSIDFPDVKEFLELTVPERRELLKQLEEGLPKAEEYAEECEAASDEELEAEYEEKLDEKVEEGIIGKHTHDEFLKEFKTVNHKDKVHWNKQAVFNGQMARYEKLWSEIRETLQGEALESIESKIDDGGYREINNEFGALKQSENRRLNTEYMAALKEYQQEGIIGRHTVAEFSMWMYQQNLSDKYSAEDALPDQMTRYEELGEKIEELDEEQQDYLKSKIDAWGYTELDQQYQKFKGEIPANDGSDSKALSQIRSHEMKDAIVEADEMLTEDPSKKKGFIKVLNKMFNRVNRDSFDATSFEAEVHKKAAAENPAVKREVKGRAADDEVDFYGIGQDAEVLEESGKSEVTDEIGFVQVATKKEDGGVKRQAQLTINEEEGLEHFFEEQGERGFTGKKDDLSLAVWTDAGRTVEMDLQEVRALRDYLKETEKKESEEKKAA